MIMRRHFALVLLGSFLIGCGSTSAADTVPASVPGDRLTNTQLSEQRAGFSWNGLDMNFGAEMRSYVGDQLVVRTNVSWTAQGSDVQRTLFSTPATAAAAEPGAGARDSGLAVLGQQQRGMVLANGGATAFLQRTDGVIQNILINTASNVDLRQDVDAKLDIANFSPFLSGVLAARVVSALSGAGAVSSVRDMSR